jgi:hypothetical protein
MKAILLAITAFILAPAKTQIQPTLWTNAQITISQISVIATNKTDVSIDLVWFVYKSNDSLNDEGRMQIVDSDLINYGLNPDSFSVHFICDKKGWHLVNN